MCVTVPTCNVSARTFVSPFRNSTGVHWVPSRRHSQAPSLETTPSLLNAVNTVHQVPPCCQTLDCGFLPVSCATFTVCVSSRTLIVTESFPTTAPVAESLSTYAPLCENVACVSTALALTHATWPGPAT